MRFLQNDYFNAGMSHSWEDFYYKGLEEIIRKFNYPISQEVVEKSFHMLKG